MLGRTTAGLPDHLRGHWWVTGASSSSSHKAIVGLVGVDVELPRLEDDGGHVELLRH
jgi:hypothetical protein